MYGDAGDPPKLQADGRTDGQTDRRTTCNRKTVLCTIVHRTVKQRRNTGIADVIGIADIVLLSILSIDPARSACGRLGHVQRLCKPPTAVDRYRDQNSDQIQLNNN